MIQFIDSLQQIKRCDSVMPIAGMCRHLQWQARKMFHRFPCELMIANSRLHVDGPLAVAALINSMGEYDYNNMNFIRSILRQEKSTFVDIGANIGSYTLVASEVENARVVSIEAHPATFNMLEANVRLNRRANVTSLNVALSSQDGEVCFTDVSGSSVNRVEPTRTAASVLRVPGRCLSTVCDELDIMPDIIKVDVEGHEVAVLAGFGEFAKSARLILIEGGEGGEVRRWMTSAGYLGPWYCHFKERALLPTIQHRGEDPVFIRPTFLPNLQRLNFEVAELSG